MKKSSLTAIVTLLLLLSHSSGEFTVLFIPDTQHLTDIPENHHYFGESMTWIVEQKEALNIQFVSHLGDITQSRAAASEEWPIAVDALSILTEGGVKWAPVKGNHDDLTFFRDNFPVSDWQGYPWFGGFMPGYGMENAYYLFNWEGMDFIVLALEDYRDNVNYDALAWGNEILDQYSEHRAIVVSHNVNENGNMVINEVSKLHDNVFLTIGGHSGAREAHWTEQTPGGNTLHAIVADYQWDAEAGQGTLRYFTFKPQENQVCSFVYNPATDAYETDGNSQFCFDYEMAPASTPQISGVTQSPSDPQVGEAVAVSATITDDVGISSAFLRWGTEPGSFTNEVAMTADGDIYSADIPGQETAATVYYVVEASDGDGNPATSDSYSYAVDITSAVFAASRNEPVLMRYDRLSGMVHFSGLADVRSLTLTDIGGRSVSLGSALKGGMLDMSGFGKGVYFIQARKINGNIFEGRIFHY